MASSLPKLVFGLLFVVNCILWSQGRYGQIQSHTVDIGRPSLAKRYLVELGYTKSSFDPFEGAVTQVRNKLLYPIYQNLPSRSATVYTVEVSSGGPVFSRPRSVCKAPHILIDRLLGYLFLHRDYTAACNVCGPARVACLPVLYSRHQRVRLLHSQPCHPSSITGIGRECCRCNIFSLWEWQSRCLFHLLRHACRLWCFGDRRAARRSLFHRIMRGWIYVHN